MSYLNRFFQEVFDNNPLPSTGSSFDQATDAEMAAHLQMDQYDSFQLTDAIRPAMDLKIKPSQGRAGGAPLCLLLLLLASKQQQA